MKPKALLRLFGLAFGIAFAAGSSAGTCPGRIPNPLTDVCWSCTAPSRSPEQLRYRGAARSPM